MQLINNISAVKKQSYRGISMAEEETAIKMKICLLGDGGVGKTSLVYRFIQNRFSTDFKSTLGVNLLKHDVVIDKYRITAQILQSPCPTEVSLILFIMPPQRPGFCILVWRKIARQ